MTLEAFNEYVTEALYLEIPSELFEGLNLGVIVSPKIEIDKKEPNMIIKGHYVKNRLGRQIILYYGSFMHLYAHLSESALKEKILATIKHELTHHLEALAGQEDLAKKEQYMAYLRATERKHRRM